MSSSNADSRGAIFTRREVVDFIFALARVDSTQSLHRKKSLEPSFGGGDFLLPLVENVLRSFECEPRKKSDEFEILQTSIYAIELHSGTYESTRAEVVTKIVTFGFTKSEATTLVDKWMHVGDFLIEPIPHEFDFVVGNPPYIRQELIPDIVLTEYRARYSTVYDRADIYVPFIERSLSLMAEGGKLGFICADRWMKNKYGGPLRRLVSKNYHVEFVVDMTGTQAFQSEVTAYPAITVISKRAASHTRVASRPTINADSLKSLAKSLHGSQVDEVVSQVQLPVDSESPWLLESNLGTGLVRKLEQRYPSIEDVGCRVGIGVATGADKVFIGRFDCLDVESDRKLPLAMTKDIQTGEVQWKGNGVVNPFHEDGTLVDLAAYPKLAKFLGTHEEKIRARNVAKRNPKTWYRTIDRITPSLATTPKLLVPDIKGDAHFVYESGKLYPHHNLYFITSSEWDLHALQALLMSGIAKLFVSTYSTKMRGEFLRFQAQYLRRIRIPAWNDVPSKVRKQLSQAGENLDYTLAHSLASKLYGLTEEEAKLITF